MPAKKYTENMPDKLIKYFEGCRNSAKNSNLAYTPIPNFKNFAKKINISHRTFDEWVQKHEKFAAAKAVAVNIQKQCRVDFSWYSSSKYDESMPEMIIDHFTEITQNQTCAQMMPTLESFAVKMSVSRFSLNRWADKHEEFKKATEFCKTVQHDWLLQRAASGEIPQTIVMFLLKCLHGMTETAPENKASSDVPELTFNDVLGVHAVCNEDD